MKLNSREEIIALTPLWKGERFPDGRPKVPQKYIYEMYKLRQWRLLLNILGK